MEFFDIYLSEDIIDKFFHKLSYGDMISFSHINKHTYHQYNNYIKYLIYDFLNTDYRYFKLLMKTYKYSKEEIFEMGISATKDVKTIWGGEMYGYYDLRFLFELIYAGLNINNQKIIEPSKNHINLHIVMERIKRCISFNRFETIQNIHKEIMLYPLHIMFRIRKKDKNENIYSIEWETI